MMRYESFVSPGIEAIEWMASVFFLGIGQLIHDVVESATCASNIAVPPEPIAAACRSGTPVITTVSVASPRFSATAGATVATALPIGCSGGSVRGSIPTIFKSCSSYS